MPMLCTWGHSVGLRIPKAVLESAQLGIGDEVLVRSLDDGSLLVVPIRERPGATVSGGGKAACSPAKKVPEKW